MKSIYQWMVCVTACVVFDVSLGVDNARMTGHLITWTAIFLVAEAAWIAWTWTCDVWLARHE